jgi:hypothetical protein
MDTPYRVERTPNHYVIYRTGDGALVLGDDPVLLHRIVELLNREAETNTGSRPASD